MSAVFEPMYYHELPKNMISFDSLKDILANTL